MSILVFLILFIVSFSFGGYIVIKYYFLMNKAQPEAIDSGWLFKLKSVFINVLLQKKLYKQPIRGIFHVIIFYGFLIYGVHTTSQIIGGALGDYYFYLPSFLGHSTEIMYDLILDIFSILVLIGLGFFSFRRWILRAPELDRPSIQSFFIITLISCLMLFTLISEPAKMILQNQVELNPIRGAIVDLYRMQNLSQQAVEFLFLFGWWGHILTVFALTIYVPMSKHAHLIWAPLNFFYARTTPKGAIRFLDTENAPVWGAANVQDFSWKNLLDGLSCIECGRCQLVCPASRTGKVLSPKDVMVDLKHAFMEQMPKYAKGLKEGQSTETLAENNELRVIDNYTSTEALWACTTCYACVDACPVGNNQVDAIIEMRRSLVLNEGNLPSELQSALINIENQSNPWGVGAHKREEWTEGMDIKTMAEWEKSTENPEVLFWVGCAGAFDDRNKKVVRSFANIMQKAGVQFGILGTEENCTGDSARRAGNEYLFQSMAQTNIETMAKYDVKKIVTTCPHCFNTLQNEYPQMGGSYDVEHHTVFIEKLLKNKQVSLDSKKAEEVSNLTYHDSCYLGRYNDNYSSPREVIEMATGIKVKEAVDHHDKSLCCGAGGAQMWKEEEKGEDRVNIKRANQLLDTGATTIASACPFCITMVQDGVNSISSSDEVVVQALDVAEIVEKALS